MIEELAGLDKRKVGGGEGDQSRRGCLKRGTIEGGSNGKVRRAM